MTTLIFDTETTGLVDPELVSAAWLRLDEPGSLQVTESFDQLYQPAKHLYTRLFTPGEIGRTHLIPRTHCWLAEQHAELYEADIRHIASALSVPHGLAVLGGGQVDPGSPSISCSAPGRPPAHPWRRRTSGRPQGWLIPPWSHVGGVAS